jgi:hypothetical protein
MEVQGMPWTAPSGVNRGGAPGTSTQVSQIRTEKRAEEVYARVRDSVLNPAFEKRVFQNEAEFGSYFSLGSLQPAIIERLLSQRFAKRANKRFELCRFEPGILTRVLNSCVYLDNLSFRLALPRLGESELVRIRAAVVALSRGPRLVEACDQIWVIMSILHGAACRPLLSIVTQDLHRQLIPYTYLDRDHAAFENLVRLFLRLPEWLQEGRLQTLCSELSSAYQGNVQLLSPALAEFRRFHREQPPALRVARAALFEAPALHVPPQFRAGMVSAAA